MDTLTLLREQLQQAHQFLESTMADVTPEQAHWIPPGIANPLGATYIHILVAEDMFVNTVFKGGAPLLATTWAGKTGFNEPMPVPGPEWAHYAQWARRVQVDLPAMRQYAQAIYAASDNYLASLTPNDLDRVIDLSRLGVGQVTLAHALSRLVIAHVDNIIGEISCLKGLQGAKGYAT
jgi:DinB superfamily